jgi:hypothetical protein
MVLCWHHLTNIIHELLSSSFGKALGLQIEKEALSYLWRGDAAEAIKEITANRGRAINREHFNKTIRYIKARRPYIVNYELRQADAQWIANTRVEKFNDWAVSARCKGQGRTWTYKGVKATKL